MDDRPETERPDPLEHEQAKAQLQRFVSTGMRTYGWLIAVQSVIMVGLVAAVIYLLVGQANATRSIQAAAQKAVSQANAAKGNNDRRWCSTMDLLTQVPVTAPSNAAANPSKETSYKLYEDFLQLKREFGCD